MDHTIAQAIRAIGAKICRRLDVLIVAAGQPPVQDIEGTFAPRNTMAPHALQTPYGPPKQKKRGRPPNAPKTTTPPASPKRTTPTPKSSGDTCEVSIIFQCVFFIRLTTA